MIRTVGLNLLDFFETEIERQKMAKSPGTENTQCWVCILAREEEGIAGRKKEPPSGRGGEGREREGGRGRLSTVARASP
jgi:hypothetical protein